MNGKPLLLLAYLFFSFGVGAQQFGGFPPSVKWRQIKSDTARIIFEGPVDSQAQAIAAIIHQAARINPNPLGNNVRPVNVVLHRNTTLANGYVALGPFRSEYYLIPGSNIFEFGSTPWSQTLAVHEYRHVHQYGNFNRGLSRVASVLFGQEGQAAFNGLSVPDWFFEGDAVHAETVETVQGRGRAPAFFNGFRALWHEGKNYSWAKLRNGSLKDFVPNQYPLGYLLVNYGYLKYGPDFWKNVTANALSFRGFFGFFGGSIRRYSGKTFPEFRNEALAFYKHEVSTRRDAVKKRETVTDYFFPQQIGTDSLLYLKSSYRRLPAFYVRNPSGEHRIKLRNISTEDWFSYRNGQIVYTAYGTSARWSLVNYSDVVLLDIASGKEKRVTKKGRYFTPDLSPDGRRILAVAFTDSLRSELHVLNVEGGIEKRISAPSNALFVHPRFVSNDEFVVAVREAASTMSLRRGSLATGTLQTLLAPGAATLGYPFVQGQKLYFVSSLAGNDDLYELELSAAPVRRIRQLTFGQTGAYFPSIAGDTLLWSQFTSNGYRLQKAALSRIKGSEISGEEMGRRFTTFPVALQESPNVLATGGRRFQTGAYKKTTGLFNVHSWRPNYSDPEVTFSVFSDNVLNTFSNELFYRYNINETSHGVGFNTFYGGLFPVLNAGVVSTFDGISKSVYGTYTYNQFETRAGFGIPLNFTGNNTYKFLSVGSDFQYSKLAPTGLYKTLYRSRTLSYLNHYLSFRQQLPRAVQHLFPKLGYSVLLRYRHYLNETGSQLLANAALYLPSFRNHSFVVNAAVQENDTVNFRNFRFSNLFANARGYNDYYFPRMWKLSGNYHMPLLYPDKGVPGVVYLLRVRSNFFYDYARVYLLDKTTSFNQRSVGGEVFFDTRLFNSLPASIGLRVSHLFDDDFSGSRPKGRTVYEVVLPLDLIPQ